MTDIASELHARIKSNPALLTALTNAVNKDAFIEIFLKAGQKFSLNATREDACAVFTFIHQDDALSDSELEMIAGGGSLLGGDGNDTLWGTDGNDVISGESGNDIMTGGSGNDTFFHSGGFDGSNSGNDIITDYTRGEDAIYLSGDHAHEYQMIYDEETGDTIISYGGNTLTVQGVQLTPEDISIYHADVNNNNIQYGREGNDFLIGLGGNDTMDGGAGNDKMYGSGGNNSMDGGAGDDTMEGGANNDFMIGGAGNDSMNGDGGYDTMDGGDGDDSMDGGVGNDSMDGGDGNDILFGGQNDDTLSGGGGNDAFIFTQGDGDDVITDFTPGEDTIQFNGLNANDYQMTYNAETNSTTITYEGGTITVEGVQLTTDDILSVSEGGDGNDVLEGTDENDALYGKAGNDVLTGGGGSDVFVFGGDDGVDQITDFNPDEDTLILDGVETADDLNVMAFNGKTIVAFGNTVITLDNVELTIEQILAMQIQ